LLKPQPKIVQFHKRELFSPGKQEGDLPVNGASISTWNRKRSAAAVLGLLAAGSCLTAPAKAENPLAAKVNVTTLQSYKGTPLPKPDKILVYDLVPNGDIQVDKSQKIRPRHLLKGDENPDAVGKKSEATFSEELVKRLAKTGIPVQRAIGDTAPSDNSLVIQGAFVALRQGDKSERVSVGMGLGSAEVQTKIDVRLKTSAEPVLVSQFQTQTTTAKSVGAAAPAAAGLNPAAVATKSVVTDRRKTLNSYIAKTADASAKEITKLMADQGWIKVNDKGEIEP
jgi:Domain of unknown function (DUF4410)